MQAKKTKEKYIGKLNRALKISLVVSSLVMLVALAIGSRILPHDDWGQDASGRDYGEPVYQEFADGSREEMELPGRCRGKRGEVMTLVTRLPEEIKEGTYLCFRSAKQKMRFFIDGRQIMQYDTDADRVTGMIDPAAYVFVPISVNDAGKELYIETQTDSSYSGYVYRIHIGSQMGIWKDIVSGYGGVFFIAILLLILSIFFIVTSVALSYLYRQEVELIYMAGGIFIAALWELANCEFRQLFFPNLSVPNDLSFYAVMLLPLAFLQYVNILQKGRYRRMFLTASLLDVCVALPCAVLHIRKIVDFTDTITLLDLTALLSIGVIFVGLLRDIRAHRIKEYRAVAVGLLLAIVCAIIQIISYFQHINIFNGVTLELGMLCLLFSASYHTFSGILMEERERQKAKMEADAKGRFLAHMSHEIRTPVNAVLGLDTMILRESKDLNIKQYAMDIRNAGQNLLSIINDILDISKIESGKMEIVPVEYDLSVLIHDVWNMIHVRAEDKGLELSFDVQEDLPLKLYGDDVRIRQILINLLSNAVKYTEKGSVTLRITGEAAEPDTNRAGESGGAEGALFRLHVRVRDTGIGIKDEDLDRLFTDFERIDEERNRNVEGTGLGMSITTQLLDLMGSRLEVESEYGRGSAFSFVLEQKALSDEPLGDWTKRIGSQAKEYEYHAAFTAPKAKILVVDDKEMNRRVFKHLLKAMRVQIDEAADGWQCLKMTEKKKYDLIFLDHMMPGIDGCETLKRMRAQEKNKTTYTVALTANVIAGVREMFYAEGFDEYMAKPIDPDQLEHLLFTVLPEELLEKAPEDGGVQEKDTVNLPEAPDLPEVPGVNWMLAMYHLRDAAIVRETAVDLCRNARHEWEELQMWYDAFAEVPREDYEKGQAGVADAVDRYRIQVHAMKSSAALLGATEVSELAKLLEYAAKEGRLDRIHMEMPLFKERWEALGSALEVLLPQEEKKPFSAEAVDDYLTLLELAQAEGNTDMTDLMIAQIAAFALPEALEEDFRALEQAAYALDGDGIRESLARFREKLAGTLSKE